MSYNGDLYVPTYDVQKSVAHLLDSDSDDEIDTHNVTPIKRRRVEQRPPQRSRASPPSGDARQVARRLSTASDKSPSRPQPSTDNVVVLSSDDEDDGDEVLRLVAKDPEAIRFKELAMRSAAAAAAVISIDSDEDDQQAPQAKPAPSVAAPSSVALTVQWLSRTGTVESDSYSLAPTDAFQVVLDAVCAKLHVPTDVLQMAFDGSPVLPYETPESKDVEDGDQIDVVVDWDKVKAPQAAANAVRVRIQRMGSKKTKVFTIAPELTVKKLVDSFCALNNLPPTAVVLKLFGEVLREDATIESCMLDKDDVLVAESSEAAEIAVEDLNSVTIALRFPTNESETHRIDLTAKVETLVAKVCRKRHIEPSQVKLVIDGEIMRPDSPFSTYDLEGDEIVDVKLT